MTAAASRKRRGGDTQNLAAAWFKAHGWPYAESAGAGRSGRDVLGMPGLAAEVKSRRLFRPSEWVRQAVDNAGGDLPFVVSRPDGMGPASIADWPVTLRLADFTDLLRAAGYGTPTEGEQ